MGAFVGSALLLLDVDFQLRLVPPHLIVGLHSSSTTVLLILPPKRVMVFAAIAHIGVTGGKVLVLVLMWVLLAAGFVDCLEELTLVADHVPPRVRHMGGEGVLVEGE